MYIKVKQILCDIKNDSNLIDCLDNDTDIVNDVGLDSLQMIDFVLKVVDEFNIEIDFEEFSHDYLRSINKFCSFIETQTITQSTF